MANDTLVQSRAGGPRSYFAKRLANEPELACRCDVIDKKLREEASDEVEALDRSEQLTSDDFSVVVNARADSAMSPDE